MPQRLRIDRTLFKHIPSSHDPAITQQRRELLRALGCSELQGYLFSPAQPAAELKRLFFSHAARREAVA
jgi:EAL domain-containing protein (putative c-di-GMP-specific phosphodiesterase class I)